MPKVVIHKGGNIFEGEVGERELPDPGAHDEVGVFLHLALEDFAPFVDHHFRHSDPFVAALGAVVWLGGSIVTNCILN